MKKGQFIVLVCAFLIIEKGKAQTLFNNAYDYLQQLQFPFNVLQLEDSSYLTLGGSVNTSTNEICQLLSWFEEDGLIDSQKCLLKNGYQVYMGEPGSFGKTFDGGYYCGGGLVDNSNNQNYGLLVKYNSAGDTMFTHVYGDSALWQTFYGSSQTSDSGFVLIGVQYDTSANPNGDYWVMRTDKNSNLIWEKTYDGGIDDDAGFRAYEISGNRFIFSGGREIGSFYQPWLIICDDTGAVITSKVFGGAFICGGGRIEPTLDQGYILYACLDTVINNGDYPYPRGIAKLDSNLNIKWKAVYNYPKVNVIWNLHQLSDSSIVFVGWQNSDTDNVEHGWLGKLDKNGNKLWEHMYRYGNSTFNELRDIHQTTDGGYIVCGATTSPGQDIWLLKLDSNGCLVPGCITNIGTIEVSDQYATMSIYPNPCFDEVNIAYHLPDQIQQATLFIYSLAGALVQQQNITAQQQTVSITLHDLSSGMYLVELSTSEGVITQKLLKQ